MSINIQAFQKHMRTYTQPPPQMQQLTLLDIHFNSVYVPQKVTEYIKTCTQSSKVLRYIYPHITITLVNPPPKNDEFAHEIARVASYLQTVTSQIHPQFVYIHTPKSILTDKSLNQGKSPAPEDINSGVTFSSAGTNPQILVYRQEEAGKVAIHELIHAYKLDIFPPTIEIPIPKELKSTVQVRYNETYTELAAAILYTIIKSRSIKQLRDHFVQMAKMIMCSHIVNGQFKQDTHAFEYIVAKGYLVCGKSTAQIYRLIEDKVYFNTELKEQVATIFTDFTCTFPSLPKS